MPQYNEMFKLSVDDMDLIETALRRTQHALSQEQLVQSDEGKGDHVETIRQIRELLGRLHNQKIFYRPKDSVYIGG
jgi:hypothetical protein